MFIEWTVIVFIILVAIFLLYIKNVDKNETKAKDGHDLAVRAGREGDLERYIKKHPELTNEQAMIKFVSLYKDTLTNEAKENDLSKAKWEEEEKKDRIVKRVFAYKYQDFIYSLYADIAKKSNYFKQFGILSSQDFLIKDFIIDNICKNYNIDADAAENLYQSFLDNNILSERAFETLYLCELGSTLTTFANIISEQDLNLNKYLSQHE